MKKRTQTFSLTDVVCYGGEWVMVAEMVRHLQATMPNQACVDRYLQGFFLDQQTEKK